MNIKKYGDLKGSIEMINSQRSDIEKGKRMRIDKKVFNKMKELVKIYEIYNNFF